MDRYTDEVAILVAQTGPLNGQRFTLRKTTLLGRDPACDIVIPDRQVSRQHVRLSLIQTRIQLEDLGSKNGTYVNGNPVDEPMLLEDGDVIQIAVAQKFVFFSSDSTVPLDAQYPGLFGATIDQHEPRLQAQPGRLRLETRSRRVWIRMGQEANEPVEKEVLPPLSLSQFRLLQILYENQGRVVPRYDLVTAIWGESQAYEISEQALDALVRRLRERIASIDPQRMYIVTVRGHGLRLDNPSE